MARFITVFTGSASPGLVPAFDTVHGDKVIQVFGLPSGAGELTGSFGPVIPADGFIAQTGAIAAIQLIALLERPGA